MTTTDNTSFLGMLHMPEDHADSRTMIKIDHVTMVFNIANEQLNSLKEYAIALSRRELRFKEFRALDNISFEVKQGDVFGILGTNGSGKSTLLKIIAGVLDPSKGNCSVEGSIAPLIELGAGFDLELTARENIYLNGALLGYSKRFIQEHFEEIVDFAEVGDFLDMPMKNYSSGMVARIAFAIATVIVPDVLIVDEVLSVGDFMFQQKCEQRIQELIKEHNVTVLIVSHNNAQIERLCNKAVWIEKGHMRAIGSAKEVCEIYRALGGRTGSKKSEEAVIAALGKVNPNAHPKSACIFGENRYGTAAKLANAAKAPSDIIILTNSDDIRSNVISCSLAALLNAIILTTRHDALPDATAQEILHRKPSTIIAVGDSDYISDDVLNGIQAEGSRPSVKRIEGAGASKGFDVFEYGKNVHPGGWSNAAVLSINSANDEIAIISSLAAEFVMPLFLLNDNEQELSDRMLKKLSEFERLIVISNTDSTILFRLRRDVDTKIEVIPVGESGLSCEQIGRWVDGQRAAFQVSRADTAVITDPQNEIDNCLLGLYASRINAKIVYIDPRSLDSMASAINWLSAETNIESLIFIGNDLKFGKLDRLLLESALVR